MTTTRHYVEQKIAAILDIDAAFAAIKRFKIGIQYRVPIQDYPFGEIVILGEDEFDEETGIVNREYTGEIRFEVLQQDTSTVVGRIEVIESYVNIDALVDAAVKLLRKSANRTLGGLQDTVNNPAQWSVQDFTIGSSVRYGFGQRDERENLFQNFGIIPFICRTRELKT